MVDEDKSFPGKTVLESWDPNGGKASFRTLDEARKLAISLGKICPHIENAIIGLAELMFNAVEHGNLDINYDEKTLLEKENRFLSEIERRLKLPEYKDKIATISWERTEREILFTIEDQGNGFNCQPYMEVEPERLLDNHGRGIIMAQLTSFSKLQYLGRGNRVQATIPLVRSGEKIG
jgi:two-component system, cell cycle response regulator